LSLDALPQAVLIADEGGEILARNAAAKAMLPAIGNVAAAFTRHGAPGAFDWAAQMASLAEAEGGLALRNLPLSGEGNRQVLVDVFLRRLAPHRGRRAVLVSVTDVSERSSMERRLAASERMEAMSKFAAKIAHELNNPLDGILRYVGLAKRVAGKEAAGYLDNARSGLVRMAEIIRNVLGRSRRGKAGIDWAPVERLLDEAIRVMQPSASALSVAIICEAADDASVPGPAALFQVFCNIIKNALDAMPGGGLLKIRLYRTPSHCTIEFADTGCGLTEEQAKRLFKPFYTTKAPGEGMGLGLAVCKDILARMGGTIGAAPGPSGGAVITVHLPIDAHATAREETKEK